MSQAFVGLVFLAIVGGAAESGSAIAMGRANRMDLAVSIAIGSVQIGSCGTGARLPELRARAPAAPAPVPAPARGRHLHRGDRGRGRGGDGRSNWFKGSSSSPFTSCSPCWPISSQPEAARANSPRLPERGQSGGPPSVVVTKACCSAVARAETFSMGRPEGSSMPPPQPPKLPLRRPPSRPLHVVTMDVRGRAASKDEQ